MKPNESLEASKKNIHTLMAQFDEEVVETRRFPYLQIKSPQIGCSIEEIKESNQPWGWFMPIAEAEAARFTPTRNFSLVEIRFGSKGTKVEGYLFKQFRFCLLHRSDIEVQERTESGWRYVGKAYENGVMTKYGDLAKKNREDYRMRNRLLLFLLDEENKPLHEIPFQIGMSAGAGSALGVEINEFRRNFEAVYFKSQGKANNRLSERAHCLGVIKIRLGLHKHTSGKKSAYVVPTLVVNPSLDEEVKKVDVQRKDRSVLVQTEFVGNLIIQKDSAEGRIVLATWESYSDFAELSDRKLQRSEEVIEEEGKYQGIDFSKHLKPKPIVVGQGGTELDNIYPEPEDEEIPF